MPNAESSPSESPRQSQVTYLLAGAFRRMATTEWGPPDAPPVICVHGLSRQGRDFDALASALSDRYHVICPDLPGRGRSDWLPEPALYAPPSYAVALGHLLARVNRPVFWVGTSLGGICGMLVAAAGASPIRRMVLNDIGPFLPKAALARIASYVGDMPEFSGIDEVEAFLRRVHAPFGSLSDADWRQMAVHSARALPDEKLTLHYDPAMTIPMRQSAPADLEMWPIWDRITAPMLAIRGETSDLLLPDTFTRMGERARTHLVHGAGHAPALMDAPTIDVIRRFLDEGEDAG